MKKQYFLMMLFSLMSLFAVGQSPWAITHSRTDADLVVVKISDVGAAVTSSKAVSLRNLWIGSSVLWNVDENAPIESPGIKGTLLYTAYENEKLSIPIVGNISLNDSGGVDVPDEGISLGVYPNYAVQTNSSFALVVHGGVGYRRYSDEQAELSDLTELKILGGIEMALFMGSGLPVTLNVGPVHRFRQGDLPNSTSLDITGILPLGNGLGFLVDGSFPFGENDVDAGNSLLRMGIIVNGRL